MRRRATQHYTISQLRTLQHGTAVPPRSPAVAPRSNILLTASLPCAELSSSTLKHQSCSKSF